MRPYRARLEHLWTQGQNLKPRRLGFHLPYVPKTELMALPVVAPCAHVSDETNQTLRLFFVHEIWISESPPMVDMPAGATLDLLELAVSDNKPEFLALCSAHGLAQADSERAWAVVRNLYGATQRFVPRLPVDHNVPPFAHITSATFGVGLAKEIHRAVFGGLAPTERCGAFRTTCVRPSESLAVYCPPEHIAGRMQTLFAFVAQQAATITKREQALLLGTLFLSEFLLIHPFIDGNGRTARILFGHLMAGSCAVPVSLFLTTRAVYIDVLEERSLDLEAFPRSLAMYVFACARKTTSDVCYLGC